jgi:Ca2+/Na+ antiporter
VACFYFLVSLLIVGGVFCCTYPGHSAHPKWSNCTIGKEKASDHSRGTAAVAKYSRNGGTLLGRGDIGKWEMMLVLYFYIDYLILLICSSHKQNKTTTTKGLAPLTSDEINGIVQTANNSKNWLEPLHLVAIQSTGMVCPHTHTYVM